MIISCLIVDDEPLARQRLSSLVMKISELSLLDTCKSGRDAVIAIEELKPDMIFLDIQMKDMSGFDVLNKLKLTHKPLVIFVTAFDKYAVKAFDHLALDYLLKPFKNQRFEQAVDRALVHFKNKEQSAFERKIDHLLNSIDDFSNGKNISAFKYKFPIKTGNSTIFLDTSSIKYILASGSYADIHSEEKTYIIRSSISKLLSDIQDEQLVRIHRSTIINLDFIDKIHHSNFSEMDVQMNDGKVFRISKSYKRDFSIIAGI